MVVLKRLPCIAVSLPSTAGAVNREIQFRVTPPQIRGLGEMMVLIIIHHCCGRWQHWYHSWNQFHSNQTPMKLFSSVTAS
jgi:hypothetical protein